MRNAFALDPGGGLAASHLAVKYGAMVHPLTGTPGYNHSRSGAGALVLSPFAPPQEAMPTNPLASPWEVRAFPTPGGFQGDEQQAWTFTEADALRTHGTVPWGYQGRGVPAPLRLP